MPIWPLVTQAFAWGLVMSAVLFALILAVLRANAEIMLNDYPRDIQAKWGPMTEPTKRQRVFVTILVLAVVLGLVAWSTKSLRALGAGDVTFVEAFTHFGVMLGTFNLLDCFVLDFALVRRQPRFVVLPGTEGLPGYTDYWFHVRGFLIGIPIALAASALFAAIASMLR